MMADETKLAKELRPGDVVDWPRLVKGVELWETSVRVTFEDGAQVTYNPTDALAMATKPVMPVVIPPSDVPVDPVPCPAGPVVVPDVGA